MSYYNSNFHEKLIQEYKILVYKEDKNVNTGCH
jgi:hypothetical protein